LGARARVAAGPAALSVATGAILVPTLLRQERLRGAQRKAAGTPWGLVVTFCPPVPVPQGETRAEAVRAMTQAWIDMLGEDVARYPTHWHMLQKVFVADLDPRRRAAAPAEERRAAQPAAPARTAKEQP
jgi:KDO2-lipid IV(A) lauroyltransferase